MKSIVKIINAVLFVAAYTVGCFSLNSDSFNGYLGMHSTYYLIIRFLIIFAVMFVLSIMNRKNNFLIQKAIPVLLIIGSLITIYNYYFSYLFGANYSHKLWQMLAFSVTQAGVFFGFTVSKIKDYDKFYKIFWRCFALFFVFVIIACFARNPNEYGRTVNTIIGDGTIKYFKAFFDNPNGQQYLMLVCFGNIIILMPTAFIITAYFEKIKVWQLLLIGFIIPFGIEGYQYIFSCGNVDIDDIILNFSGFLVGFMAQKIIYANKIAREN
ncbi:MAG: VanZ family protein [Eubacterium sp.]